MGIRLHSSLLIEICEGPYEGPLTVQTRIGVTCCKEVEGPAQ